MIAAIGGPNRGAVANSGDDHSRCESSQPFQAADVPCCVCVEIRDSITGFLRRIVRHLPGVRTATGRVSPWTRNFLLTALVDVASTADEPAWCASPRGSRRVVAQRSAASSWTCPRQLPHCNLIWAGRDRRKRLERAAEQIREIVHENLLGTEARGAEATSGACWPRTSACWWSRQHPGRLLRQASSNGASQSLLSRPICSRAKEQVCCKRYCLESAERASDGRACWPLPCWDGAPRTIAQHRPGLESLAGGLVGGAPSHQPAAGGLGE